ncbi:MAG TPA: HAD-IA family hydrolase [Acidobacteriota bacterium]
MKYSCFLFDLDNTLIVSEPLIFASFNHIAQKYSNRSYTPDEIRAMYGPPEGGMIARIVPEEYYREATARFYDFYAAHHSEYVQVIPELPPVIERLHQARIRLGVITGKGERSTEITLRAIGLRRFFDAVITGEHVQRWKPDPEPAERALEILDSRPGETLFLGDQMADFGCARAAGIDFAAVLWDSFQSKQLLDAKPELVFRRPLDFVAWVEENLNRQER